MRILGKVICGLFGIILLLGGIFWVFMAVCCFTGHGTMYAGGEESSTMPSFILIGGFLGILIGCFLVHSAIQKTISTQTVITQQSTPQQPTIQQQQVKTETPKTQDEILRDWYQHIDKETNKVWDRCPSCGKYTFLLAEKKKTITNFYCQECGVKYTLRK